jgi:hypothetical protein
MVARQTGVFFIKMGQSLPANCGDHPREGTCEPGKPLLILSEFSEAEIGVRLLASPHEITIKLVSQEREANRCLVLNMKP